VRPDATGRSAIPRNNFGAAVLNRRAEGAFAVR
jgi:hypothetical protein